MNSNSCIECPAVNRLAVVEHVDQVYVTAYNLLLLCWEQMNSETRTLQSKHWSALLSFGLSCSFPREGEGGGQHSVAEAVYSESLRLEFLTILGIGFASLYPLP